jgi:hypothetical protein
MLYVRIPLEPLMLVGIVLISVGLLLTLAPGRFPQIGILLAGLGTVSVGAFLFTIYSWYNPVSFFNGLIVLCGLWMVMIGLKRQ